MIYYKDSFLFLFWKEFVGYKCVAVNDPREVVYFKWKWAKKKKKKSSYFIRYLRGQLDADKDILKSDIAFFFITKHNISGKFSIESVQETI